MYLANLIIMVVCLSAAAGKNLRKILPTTLEIREGEDMQLHLIEALKDEISCYVRTPKGVNCNLKVEDDEACDPRINYWSTSGKCGVYVKNVTKLDEGIWRLTSKDTNDRRIVDIAEIKVLDKYQITESLASITTGLTYTHPFPHAEKYCKVQHPHNGHSVIVTDDCKIELPIVTAADDGKWSAILGVKGQVEEVIQTTNISVYRDNLITGYKWSNDSQAVHLYCNFPHEEFEFCRFYNAKSKQVGLRLKDGLRKGRYGYYGAGLDEGECGLTIDSPDKNDYAEWQCIIGIKGKEPHVAGSIWIIAPPEDHGSEVMAERPANRAWASSPIITTVGGSLKLECFSNNPLSYCWISQPNNKPYTEPLQSEENDSQEKMTYKNEEVDIGKCSIVIPNVAEEHSGTWTCHMGPAPIGIEITADISVRVTRTLFAATHKELLAEKEGDSITLECKTVNGHAALQYCRFMSPSGLGINLQEGVTEDNPIEHNSVKYWYNGNGIHSGECNLVIDHLKPEHIGEWTCAARLDTLLSDKEEMDTMQVDYPPKPENLTAAAGAGIGIAGAAAVAAIVFGAYIIIKKKRRTQWQTNRQTTDEYALQRTSHASSDTSTSSSPSA